MIRPILCLLVVTLVASIEDPRSRTKLIRISRLGGDGKWQLDKFTLENNIEQLFGHDGTYNLIVPQPLSAKFQTLAGQINAKYEVLSEDLDKEVDDLAKENEEARQRSNRQTKFRYFGEAGPGHFSYFPRLNEYEAWLRKVHQDHPGTELFSIGKTHEGRDMWLLKMNKGEGKPIVFVESAIHAREWLSPATMVYIYNHLLKTNFSGVEKYEFHVLLITNPDGYEFTHGGTSHHRFWRKNRRELYYGMCYGADLNRNFDIQWGTVGVSHYCQHEIYPGDKAFSEPETRNVRDYMSKIKERTRLYLSVHTFGQMIITPYTYTTRPPVRDTENRRIAHAMAKAIKAVHGTQFHVGTSKQLGLGTVSGSSVDYMIDKMRIPFAFAFELRPRGFHLGAKGFAPPPSDIGPSGEETLQGFLTLVKQLPEM